MTERNFEKLLQEALIRYEDTEMCKYEKEYRKVRFSRYFKIKINRLFREKMLSKNIPYPEVDSAFERARSRRKCKYRESKTK